MARSSLRGLGVLLALLPQVAAAQAEDPAREAPLEEADVIRLARTHSPAAAVADATDALAEARERSAGLLPNPSLTWEREAVQTGPMGGQGSQDILRASLPIDVARPLTARALSASESAWMRAEASLSRTTAILEALLSYYDVVGAARRVEVLSRSVENLEEAARVLERREAAGTASGYESTRLAIASELGRSRLAEARGEVASAKARLAALLGLPPESLRVTTALPLLSPSEEAALAQSGGAQRPALEEAREAERLADWAEGRAAWAWLPTVQVGGGLKRADAAGNDDGYGYFVGATLSIPLFDHGQAQRRRARALRALAAARAEALTRAIRADVESALASFRAARTELERFEAQTLERVEVLLTAARSGYREGERTILEVLDAQRAQTDVAERRLGLLLAAKRAEARLRAAAGDLR